MTTVGYGDHVPHSTFTKLLACVHAFTGIALCGLVLDKAADYIVERLEFLFVRAIHMHEKIGATEILKEVETNKIKYKFLPVAILLSVLVIFGTVFLYENLEHVYGLYCVCSTISTLGYGDQSFLTGAGHIFAVFWILSSNICLAQFFLQLAEFYTEQRQKLFVRRVLTRDMKSSDLVAADLDHDKIVTSAEFILYTLKGMGKISQGDISLALERFKRRDVDHPGTLTESDLLLSRSS